MSSIDRRRFIEAGVAGSVGLAAGRLAGVKPAVGLVSRAGIIPIAHSQDTAGPMARTVTDAAILLGALVGADPDDRVTIAGAAKGRRDYTTSIDPNALEGARIGIPRKAGFAFGLPVGLSLFGPAFTEGKLLGYAFAFEQATKHRRPPRFLATPEL